MNTHRSKTEHAHRRRIWDHGFTTKGLYISTFSPDETLRNSQALQIYEDQVRIYARQLEQIVGQGTGRPISINNYFFWFSWDVMGQFAFSRSFNMMKDQKWHYAVEMLREGLKLVGPSSPVPWFLRIAFDIPLLPIVRNFQKMEMWCAKRMDERIDVRLHVVSRVYSSRIR